LGAPNYIHTKSNISMKTGVLNMGYLEFYEDPYETSRAIY